MVLLIVPAHSRSSRSIQPRHWRVRIASPELAETDEAAVAERDPLERRIAAPPLAVRLPFRRDGATEGMLARAPQDPNLAH
nr:unnamed protein product [Digitaria exilis]